MPASVPAPAARQEAIVQPLPDNQLAFYEPSAELIARVQTASGEIPWDATGKSDAWDMVEAAMGLSVSGRTEQAWRAYDWLCEKQRPDGSFWAEYQHGEPSSNRCETHQGAYLAVGLWHQWMMTGDRQRFACCWQAAVRALDFALAHQSQHGEIAWAVNAEGIAMDDALITACSNLCKSLECGIAGEALLGRDRPQWRRARQRLLEALRWRPERFDRHWGSKARYSMDWFYRVLGGVYCGEEGRQWIARHWDKFVQSGMGCRCVSDRPWATVAESCELVMALCSLGLVPQAHQLLSWLHRHRDAEGHYWTGYVWPDEAFWPEEQPSWTAAAVLLAADALHQWTPASRVLITNQLP